MKRYLLMAAVLFTFAPLALQADDFCMDCVHRFTQVAGEDRLTTEATCCMATDRGDCLTGDRLVYQNIGHGCRVESDPESGGTKCKDEGTDANCGGTGGTGGKKNDDLSWGCVYDAYGYCDVSCGSCTMV